MNIYLKDGEKDFILLTDNIEKTNIEEFERKMEILGKVMDKLENMRLNIEIEKQKIGGYKVKKLGLHPFER